MSYQVFVLFVFAVAAYFIVTDESVAAAFYYVTKLANYHIRKNWWWFLNNPRNPVVKYIVYRRSLKMAREILAEINIKEEKKN